jgi:predicted RNA-binding protein with PIN domain
MAKNSICLLNFYMQTIIIDGYNFIHAIPKLKEILLSNLEQSRKYLIDILSEYKTAHDVNIILAFDGSSDVFPPIGATIINILYSEPPNKADDDIIRLIDENNNPRSLIIVTQDKKDIANPAKRKGVKVIDPQTFYNLLTKYRKKINYDYKPEIVTKKEFDEWLEIFKKEKTNKKKPA